MLHQTILALESDRPFFTEPGKEDESRLLARAFCSPFKPTIFNDQLIYLYDIYSYYLTHSTEALDDFKQQVIRINPEREEEIGKMDIRIVSYVSRQL